MNLLLFACWHARTRGMFDAELVRNALSFSSLWADNVVKPLRGARTWMKANKDELLERARPRSEPDHDAQSPDPDRLQGKLPEGAFLSAEIELLRQQIKSIELQCEKFQENMLETLATTPPQTLSTEIHISAAIRNLRSIVEASAVPLNGVVAESLASLILNSLDRHEDAQILQAICTELTVQSL